jgi:uncharacterized protein YneF (UPF0154 family)
MELLLMVLLSLSNIACFLIGAKVGQKVVKGEEVQLPTINPMEIIREQQERKEQQRVQDKVEAIMRNIDNYDGTANGQEEVPR